MKYIKIIGPGFILILLIFVVFKPRQTNEKPKQKIDNLKLFNLKNREVTTLLQLCGGQNKLVIRYFGMNCKECIESLIADVRNIFKDEFNSKVILLNNTHAKVYDEENEYYVANIENELEKTGKPYIIITDSLLQFKFSLSLKNNTTILPSFYRDTIMVTMNN